MPGIDFKKYLRRFLKLVAWLVASFLVIFLVITLLLQFSSVQTWLTSKITTYLNNKTNTKTEIAKVAIRFPKSIGLKGIYAEDTKGDTLFYAGSIYVDVGMMGLFRNKINVQKLELNDVSAFMIRQAPDSVFNYQFFIEAFASHDSLVTKKDSTDSTPWDLKVDRVDLNNIHYHLADHYTGISFDTRIEKLRARLKPADLLNEKYHVNSLLLSGAAVYLEMKEPAKLPSDEPEKGGMPVLDIAASSLELNNVVFDYNSYDGSSIYLRAEELEILPEKFVLNEYLINLKSLKAIGLDAKIHLPDDESPVQKTLTAAEEEHLTQDFGFSFSKVMPWSVSAGRLLVERTSFSISRGEADRLAGTFDPQNFSIKDLNISARSILADPQELNMQLDAMSLWMDEKFRIEKLAMNLHLDQTTSINSFLLQTGQSKVAFSLQSDMNILEPDLEKLYTSSVAFSMEESHIMNDLVYFIPAMNQYYFNWPGNKGLKMGGDINGRFNELEVDSLWVTGPGFFSAYLTGQIQGLPQMENLDVDIPDLKLFAVPGRFFANLPDTLRPSGFNMPEYIYADGYLKGSLKDFMGDLKVRSNFGNIAMDLTMKENPEGLTPGFKGAVITESFHLNKLLKTEEFAEPFAFSLDFSGMGLKPDSMDLQANAKVENLVFRNYTYEPLQVELVLEDGKADVKSQYLDENLSYDMAFQYTLSKPEPALSGSFDLDYAQTGTLGFTQEHLLVKTLIETDLIFDLKNFFNGNLWIRNTQVASEGRIFSIPVIQVTSQSTPENYSLQLLSGFATASYKGNFSPLEVPEILTGYFTGYHAGMPLTLADDSLDYRHFDLVMQVVPDDFITQILVQGIDTYDTLNIKASYDSQSREMELDASLRDFRYSGLNFSNFAARLLADRQKADFGVHLDSIAYEEILLNEFSIVGGFENKVLKIDLGLKDQNDEPFYGFSLTASQTDSLFAARILPGSLIINGENWEINPENQLIFGNKYFEAQNFVIQNDDRLLSATSSRGESGESDLNLLFRKIDLGSFTSFSMGVIPPIGGLFNGSLGLRNIFESPAFLADLTIDHFSWDKDTIGNITLKAENPESDQYRISATIKSEVTSISASGRYNTGEQAGMNLDVILERLDLPSFEGFTSGNITDLNGFLTGNMKITGTTTNPVVAGQININETSFRVTELNTGFSMPNERILFDRQNIRLQNFDILDSSGRRATLGGSINFTDLKQIMFDLSLVSQNFQVMNVQPGQNSLYHGKIIMDSDLNLKGSQSNPTLDGRLKLNEGTNFTFTIPQSNPEAIGDEGVVEFVQPGDTTFLRMAQTTPDEIRSAFSQMLANVNVEVDRETELRIIIDELAGDYLVAKGGGVLSYGIDPGGRITLSGRYEIAEGDYLLTFYEVIRRNFHIQSGSNIVWTGDPLDATVDITAIYNFRTSAGPLMTGQISGGTAGGAAIRQQYPFMIYLKMKGKLLNPQISFELDLPQEHQNAMDGMLMSRLNQINQNESELNKQVFALLILGFFVQDNPFASMGAGPGLSSTARNSASQILSQQLNRLSDRYIRGVDINFELESYENFSDGQAMGRTELQLEVSRKFFDERMRVTVGGNIELEDETSRERGLEDIAGDFSLEYLLTPEGNLRLKGFRKRNFNDIFDGQVVETGVSLIFSRSYNQFRELFMKKEKEAEIPEEPEESEIE